MKIYALIKKCLFFYIEFLKGPYQNAKKNVLLNLRNQKIWRACFVLNLLIFKLSTTTKQIYKYIKWDFLFNNI